MPSGALAEAREQVNDYEERAAVVRSPIPLTDVEAEELSALLRDIESFLARYTSNPLAAEMQDLLEEATQLHQQVARILATIGIDASWGMIGVDAQGGPLYNVWVLNQRSSAILGEQLETPPPVNERLRQALSTYKAATGR